MSRFLTAVTLLAALLMTGPAAAQDGNEPVVETDPAIPTVARPVTVYFNADQGNRGLADYDGAIYAHTGVFTDQSPNAWTCVKNYWPTDDQHTGNRSDTQLEQVSANRYKLEIEDIRAYYNDNDTGCSLGPNETIQTMNFVFRNADGSREGKTEGGGDIIVELGDPSPGVKASIEAPPVSAINPIVVNTDTTIAVLAVADTVQTDLQSFQLFVDGTEVASTTNDTLQYDLALNQPGRKDVRIEARGTDGSVARDSIYALRAAPTTEEPVPAGLEDGINYTSPTSATLVLQAPRKSFVHVIGEFSDWEVQPAYQMKRETNTASTGQDSTRYWIRINGLTSGEEVGFQYYVEGEIRIPDPYSEKVLSPNDQFISETTYPNLKPYPQGETEQLVSVLQPGQSEFDFSAFDRPEQKDLVIYELLVRDFIEAHNYQTMQDTLAYLDRLGVNAIELMPVSEFDGNESWGYNPSMHFATDKYYGPDEELKRFIDMAHQRGIAVILDVVYNHATGQSPLIRLFNQGTYGVPTEDNPWANPEARHPFNVFNDLNHESVFTKYWLDRANEYWLTEFNVDGFRFDLSKGFTQTNTNDVTAWSSYDQSRIDILQRMADEIWAVDDEAYVILEHFAEPSEEQALAAYRTDDGRSGMMLWNNMNRAYSQSAMGFIDASDFSSDLSNTYYRNRGLDIPNYITYMESHDEQWLMHRNREFGNSSGDYSVQNLDTALNRQKLVGAFFFTVPGPRMMWQFGELGYGWAPNECLKPGGSGDGECMASAPGRVAPKPIRWEYRDPNQSPNRVRLYKTWSALLNLRNANEVFTATDTQVDLRVGQGVAGRRIELQHPSMDAVVVGNFGVEARDVTADFPSSGTWYDYFTGRAVNIEAEEQDAPIPMAPGEFHIYTSEPVSFPEAGLVPYGVAAPPPPAPADLQSSADLDAGTISLSWTASSASDLTGYQIYRGTSASFDTTGARIATLGPEATSFTDDDVALDEVYYYRVVAQDNDGMRAATSAVEGVLYPQTVAVSASRTFGDGAAKEDYRLVALPGQVSRGLDATFEDEAGTSWQAFWDDGSAEDYLQKFDGSATFDFAPGRGFWVISSSEWTVTDDLPTVPLQERDAGAGTAIDLHSGWNIVSNPLDINVAWSRVESANGEGDLQPLWRFDGTFDQDTSFASAASGEAFYFNNQSDLDSLFIPYTATPASQAKSTDAPPVLALTAQAVESGASSTVEIGASKSASDGVGTEDIIGPPVEFAPVSLRVQASDDDASARQRSLVRSLRAAEAEGQSYDLTLRAEAGTTIRLTVDGAQSVATDEVRLVNRATGTTHDLRGESSIELTPESDVTPLTVLAGSEAFVESEQSKLVPDRLMLQPNYPNPFRQQTTLEYTLPEAGEVTLEVYDILGRRVRVLVSERQQPGVHRVQWDGRNSAGQPVASGLYIGRLAVDGQSKTRKMTLVR